MEKMINFTIAIPAFKKKFLAECIESILNQTYQMFELIIVNDASPENIEEVVAKYSDKRIRYYKNEQNIGAENVVNNWNICLGYAKCDFFVLMGDDDKLEPKYLEEFSKLITSQSDLDVYHCRSKIINETSECIGLTPSWPQNESLMDNIWHRIKGYRSQYISDFVYRTNHLKSIGGFFYLPLAWASDDITSYQMISNKGIAHINEPLLNYRNNSLTISNSGSNTLKIKAIKGQEKWINEFLISFDCVGNELIVKKMILDFLPKYFDQTIKHTIRQEFNIKYFKGILFIIKELKKQNINIKQALSQLIGETNYRIKKKFQISS